jgi:hypothetical protein
MKNKEKLLAKGTMVANIVLAAGGAFCGITLLHYIYNYSWTQERHFTGWRGPVLAYILPTVLGSLMFAAMRLGRLVKIEVSMLVLSIAAATYAGELLLLEEEVLEKMRAAKELGVRFDTRDRLEVVTDLRRKGISAVPLVAPHTLLLQDNNGPISLVVGTGGNEILPLAGIAKRYTVFCNENGAYTTYVSDEHGFHNPPGNWNDRRIDIAALGDSFTVGACVPSDRNFVALIRQRHPATLNLGSVGVGPLIELALLREYLVAPSIKPKVVFWFYFEGNDLANLLFEEKNPLLRRYFYSDFSQGLLVRQVDIDQILTNHIEKQMAKETMRRLRKWQNVVKLSHLREKLELVEGRFVDRKEEVPTEKTLDLFGKILLRAKTYVNGWGGDLIFVYLPDWSRYGNPAAAENHREQVLTLIRSLNLPMVDIHDAFQAQRDPLALFPFRREGHYNEAGHRVVAEEILRILPFDKPSGPSIDASKSQPPPAPAPHQLKHVMHQAILNR